MKALTIWQPWASLLAIGAKQHETRSWPAPKTLEVGTPVAIHAARQPAETGWAALNDSGAADNAFWALDSAHLWDEHGQLPIGAVVGIATFSGCWSTGIMLRTPAMLSDYERAFGDFSTGRYCWRFVPLLVLPEPIPATGRQGLWEWEPTAEVAETMRLLGHPAQ